MLKPEDISDAAIQGRVRWVYDVVPHSALAVKHIGRPATLKILETETLEVDYFSGTIESFGRFSITVSGITLDFDDLGWIRVYRRVIDTDEKD